MGKPVVYLISGTNRGIGLALTTQLAADKNNIIYAGVRDLDNTTSEFKSLLQKHNNIIPVKINNESKADNEGAAAKIAKEQGYLDRVLANAGGFGEGDNGKLDVSNLPTEVLVSSTLINAGGPLLLLQSTRGLLEKSENKPAIFAATSSILSSISHQLPFSNVIAYGSSKAQLNWIIKSASQIYGYKQTGIIYFCYHPGLVDTRLAADVIKKAPGQVLSTSESATAILKVVNEIKPDQEGLLLNYDGSVIPF